MSQSRYSSLDAYRILVAIHNRVRDLPCRGMHADGGVAWKDLMDLVTKEMHACGIRAAKTKAEQSRRSRAKKTGEGSGR